MQPQQLKQQQQQQQQPPPPPPRSLEEALTAKGFCLGLGLGLQEDQILGNEKKEL
jgi:hypothetical protein